MPDQLEMPANPLRDEPTVPALDKLAVAISALEQLSDHQLRVLGEGDLLPRLVKALAPLRVPAEEQGQLIYDYLLRHKNGLQLLAWLRLAIQVDYSFQGSVQGERVFVSPDNHQWYSDGVMFLQGLERFGGQLGLYRNGQVLFAVTARAISKGEDIGPNDLLYVDIPTAIAAADKQRREKQPPDLAFSELEKLLASEENRESEFHAYLERRAWAFGLQYSAIESHRALDDRRIPDFTGVRARDGARDIVEIKRPTVSLFRADGEFSADFLRMWTQAERYLDFARENADYLAKEKGLRFDCPRCILIAGWNLSDQQLRTVRSKQRMNPAIDFYTYNDLLTLVRNTLNKVKELQGDSGRAEHAG